MSGYYIGMDVGGTHLRLLLEHATGGAARLYDGQGCSLNVAGYEQTYAAYAKVLHPALEQNGVRPQDCIGFCAGAAGVDTPASKRQYYELMERLGFPSQRVLLYNDCELLLHLSPHGPRVVCVAGTGSIAVGMDEEGGVKRCGGWGHLLSDEGSGSWLAKRAMAEVIRQMDGGVHCSELTRRFCEHSGLRSQHEISRYYCDHIRQKADLAQYARIVDEAATAGDLMAKELLLDAAAELETLVSVVADQVRGEEPFPIMLWGSVLTNSESVRMELMRRLRRRYSQAYVELSRQQAVEVALSIARDRFPAC